MRVLVTGAAGRIGSALRKGLRGRFDQLRLADVRDLGSARPGEELACQDLADLDGMTSLMSGVDAVVHLAAVPSEDEFSRLLKANVLGTFNVFEAARLADVRRVVFASTNHVTGFYPSSRRIGPDDPVRPDTLYGVTKVFGEALGRLYADKFGLEVVCLRIGSFDERPRSSRALSMWLSPSDAVQLVSRALTAPGIRFLVVYGLSRSSRAYWENPGAALLGYEPEDDADSYASEFTPSEDGPQGGEYATPRFHGDSAGS